MAAITVTNIDRTQRRDFAYDHHIICGVNECICRAEPGVKLNIHPETGALTSHHIQHKRHAPVVSLLPGETSPKLPPRALKCPSFVAQRQYLKVTEYPDDKPEIAPSWEREKPAPHKVELNPQEKAEADAAAEAKPAAPAEAPAAAPTEAPHADAPKGEV